MRHILKFGLFEKKQIATLYHYTKPKYLESILDSDEMASEHGYISFSRNPDLRTWYEDYRANCRIAFDGEAMSDRFSIRPHLFDPAKDPMFGGGGDMDYTTRKKSFGAEREERIMGGRIRGIKKFIIRVDVLDRGMTRDERDTVDRIVEDHPEVEIGLVGSFRPV